MSPFEITNVELLTEKIFMLKIFHNVTTINNTYLKMLFFKFKLGRAHKVFNSCFKIFLFSEGISFDRATDS
jgi:hypothetical protein